MPNPQLIQHREYALKAALESLLLLKNDGILPLKNEKNLKVALVGPNVDHARVKLGDWVLGTGQARQTEVQPRKCIITLKDALERRLGKRLQYESGAWIEKYDKYDYESAIKKVSNSDVAIIIVGDGISHCGEIKSTATLKLQGNQKQLIEGVAATGKPFIINVITSKPLILPKCADKTSAIIYQFSLSMLGGAAFDKIIFGE